MELTIAELNSSHQISDLELLPINIYLLLHYLHYITVHPSTTTPTAVWRPRRLPPPTSHNDYFVYPHPSKTTTDSWPPPLPSPPTGHHHYLHPSNTTSFTANQLPPLLPPFGNHHILPHLHMRH
ncbi:hypothetical protein O181_083722 [Austropuccinia psidii MF-1]|uniref:Uncharacterized protein n=1 Tax=Austropuccinia psidii MF-1 TaxID=1389203 RepID=A0A9Q3FUY4_9BASI|nr:hypothetical protein [Austropuccinia psidii MF-1]